MDRPYDWHTKLSPTERVALIAEKNANIARWRAELVVLEEEQRAKKESVDTIGNWWFNQRKKMFRKPTKSAQKK